MKNLFTAFLLRKNSHHTLMRIAQSIIILAPFVLFFWLLNKELVPTGVFEMSRRVDQVSPFLDKLLPDVRLLPVQEDEEGDLVHTIVGDPVFFFAHPHRGFDTIKAKVWFKNFTAPIVELGALAQEDGQVYDLHSLQNLLIDNLDWQSVTDGETTLWQRTPTFTSVAKFLGEPPARDRIATYHATFSSAFLLSGYVSSASFKKTEVTLRGFHELKTYIKDETLSFFFDYTEMNRSEGQDPISVIVVNEAGETVGSSFVKDDGDTAESSKGSGLRTVSIEIPRLPEGVYKITLQANNDIFFRSYSTPQQKVVFLNNIFFGDESGYRENPRGVPFWTEAKHLTFQTRHMEGMQKIYAGNTTIELEEPYKSYTLEVSDRGVVRGFVPWGDVEMTSVGHIAFSPDQYFNPDPVRLMPYTNIDRDDIDYVLANYTPPKRDGNWLVKEVEFDASKLVLKDGSWKFVFSTPSIEALQSSVDIGKIEMVWLRKPLWNK